MATEIKFEIVKEIGVLGDTARGWTKELNLVSWNDKPAKYDIRDWSPDHEKMSKGITFTADELAELKNVLNDMEIE